MRQLLIVTVLLLLYGSFYPWHFAVPPGPFLEPVSFADKKDLILNFWLYAPLGALAFWVFARSGVLRWILPFCLGLALSTLVELVQPFIPSRDSSLGDILANASGTLAGMFLAAWAGSVPEFSRWEMRRSAEAFLLACWAAFLLFPMFPVHGPHGPYGLIANVDKFQASPFVWTDLVVWTIAWVVAWELIPGAFVRSRNWVVIGLLLLCLPARLFLLLRVLTKAEVAAGLLVLCVSPLLRRWRIPPWALAAAILVALVLRGLTPLEFSAVATPFRWIPLGGLLDAPWQPALLILIGKVFWYGSAVWALGRCDIGLGWSSALLAVFLLGIEIIQRYLPAHVPEITDPLLALACAAAFRVAFRTPATQAAEQRYAPQSP